MAILKSRYDHVPKGPSRVVVVAILKSRYSQLPKGSSRVVLVAILKSRYNQVPKGLINTWVGIEKDATVLHAWAP